MIIDSIASPAAAASGPPCTGNAVTLSWVYILFRVGTTYYTSGYQSTGGGGNTCGFAGTNNAGDVCVSGCPSNVSFTLKDGAHAPLDSAHASYDPITGACGGLNQSTAFTWLNTSTTPSCSTYLTFINGKITSQNNAEILAAVGFGGNHTDPVLGSTHFFPLCPNTAGTGNFICGIEGAL